MEAQAERATPAIVSRLSTEFAWATDFSKQVYTTQELTADRQPLSIDVGQGMRLVLKHVHSGSLGFAGDIALKFAEHRWQLSALDNILRFQKGVRCLRIGLAMYDPEEQRGAIMSGPKELWLGHSQKLELCGKEGEAALVIQQSHNFVWAQSDTIQFLLQSPNLEARNTDELVRTFETGTRKRVEKELKGRHFTCGRTDAQGRPVHRASAIAAGKGSYPRFTGYWNAFWAQGGKGRIPKQKIKALTAESARKHMFECLELQAGEPGLHTSVEEYFKKKFGVVLEHPDLPCVLYGGKGAAIPMELCELCGGQPAGVTTVRRRPRIARRLH